MPNTSKKSVYDILPYQTAMKGLPKGCFLR